MSVGRAPVSIFRWVVMSLFAIVCAFPFAWGAFTMFKSNNDLYTVGHVPFF